MDIGKIWDEVRDKEAGDAEYAKADPDFRAKLAHAAGVVRQGGSTGIAGLEKFEEEVRKAVEKEGGPERKEPSGSNVDAALVDGSGQARSTDGVQPEDIGLQPQEEDKVGASRKKSAGKKAEAEPMTEERALKSAAAAGARVEASEVHSPSAPSAARPLAAEAPGNNPTAEEAEGAEKRASKRSKAAASKKSSK